MNVGQNVTICTLDQATRGGLLTVAWNGNGTAVLMTGPAVTVFKGEIEL